MAVDSSKLGRTLESCAMADAPFRQRRPEVKGSHRRAATFLYIANALILSAAIP
jgi:hypothetical protein